VTELVDALKAGRLDVLVGTDSLMTGIDIPGDALRLVVLLKWPVPAFKRPFEAAMSARLEARGFNAWAYYLDPLGELKARQSIGRLIRTVDDWGVLACLDPRSRNKRKFWKLIAPSNYSSNLADVENFAGLFR
jgi:Rad3-related DNA helicase